MNAAGYYHGLPGEQGDPLEASIVPEVCLSGNHCLPIYCMYTVRESETFNNCVQSPMRMIREFGCADGWIGIVRYESFARLIDSHTTGGEEAYAHGAISYGIPGPKLIEEISKARSATYLSKRPSTLTSRNIESSGRTRSSAA